MSLLLSAESILNISCYLSVHRGTQAEESLLLRGDSWWNTLAFARSPLFSLLAFGNFTSYRWSFFDLFDRRRAFWYQCSLTDLHGSTARLDRVRACQQILVSSSTVNSARSLPNEVLLLFDLFPSYHSASRAHFSNRWRYTLPEIPQFLPVGLSKFSHLLILVIRGRGIFGLPYCTMCACPSVLGHVLSLTGQLSGVVSLCDRAMRHR